MDEKEKRELRMRETKVIMDGIKDILELLIPVVLIILLLKM